MKIKAKIIDHITLIISNVEASRKFYVDLLGMQEVPRPAFDFPGAWFQAGPTQIHATVESPEAGQAGWGERGVTHISRGHHFAFEVDDAIAAAEELKSSGIEILVGPKQRPDGITQLYFADPDGHIVELFSE